MLYTKPQITGFAGQSEEVIRFIASQPLLKQISSMRSKRGFPPKEAVATFMSIPCLKEGWHQGNDEAVQDSAIDRALLMRVASINAGKCFPTREQVETFMTMPCLKEGWQQGNDEAVQDNPVNRKLLMRVASINDGKGFPTREKVEAFMTMPCLKEGWYQGNDEAVQNNPLDRDLLMRIASINNGKGFPTEGHITAFVRWLPKENKKHCLKIASRLFSCSGLPEQRVLTANERTLRQYLPDLPEYSIDDSDDDISDSDNEPDYERVEDRQMKVPVLFCSAPDKWRMNFAEFKQYLTSFTKARNNDRSQVLCALTSLMPMLFNDKLLDSPGSDRIAGRLQGVS